MQFSIISLVAALAATASANQFAARQYNGTTAAYPTGTAAATGSAPASTSQVPFTGAAAVPTHMAGSALGLVVAGGVALML